MKKSSWALLVAVVALGIATAALFVQTGGSHPTGSTAGKTATAGTYIAGTGFGVGSESSFIQVFNSTGGLLLSSSGTRVAGMNFGTCYIHPYATTIAASTTAQVDCQATANFAAGPGSALSGITASDVIQADLGTSTVGTLYGGLSLRTAMGSTTAGYITLFVQNDTGGTYTWSITANASGTAQYIAVR